MRTIINNALLSTDSIQWIDDSEIKIMISLKKYINNFSSSLTSILELQVINWWLDDIMKTEDVGREPRTNEKKHLCTHFDGTKNNIFLCSVSLSIQCIDVWMNDAQSGSK